MVQRLALGLSGGGDSMALLHALRASHPDIELHALIVDHRLRSSSADEAGQAAQWAREAGAHPTVLTWDAPRAGQGHARMARHHLLAQACARHAISLLCLGHTLDDRIETLRMRESRPGGEYQLTGPSPFDPSPVWPEGADLMIARPFLGLRRTQLRGALSDMGQGWLEDPSNDDLVYERVRLRDGAWPVGDTRETELLEHSDAALVRRAGLRRQAHELLPRVAQVTPWGGVFVHDLTILAEAERPAAAALLDALMLAVCGAQTLPTPDQIERVRTALVQRQAVTLAGVAVTENGVMGRDPGAVTGRADGAAAVTSQVLLPGQSAYFDGRWRVTARQSIQISPWGENRQSAGSVPPPLRPGLLAIRDVESGELLALPGLNTTEVADFEQLAAHRIASRLLPPKVPTWFDAEECARNVVTRLAKRDSKPNITV